MGRIWQQHGLKPRRVETFKLSRDPRFTGKLEAIAGLSLDPPEHALVLCCDEKSQIQALDRTQPPLPLKRGCDRTMRHDFKRNSTTIGVCQERNRHQQWPWFLRHIDALTPADKELHLILETPRRTRTSRCSARCSGIRAFISISRRRTVRG